MGDAKRRKAEIEELRANSPVRPPIVAVHESGHAVARILTAFDLGYEAEEAVSYIDIQQSVNRASSVSADGKMRLRFQAVTFGPKFSKEMTEASGLLIAGFSDRPVGGIEARDLITDCIKTARAAGADISKWLHATAIIAVSGAMAESKFTRRPFDDVWMGYEAEDDLTDVVSNCVCAGVETDAIEAIVTAAAEASKNLMARPDVWRAVLKLATALPGNGRMDGDQILAIVGDGLHGGH